MRHISRPALILILLASACSSPPPAKPAQESKDTAFTALASEYLEDFYRRQPTQATDLGIHKYDDQLENYSRQAIMDAVASARQFRDRAGAIEPASLSLEKQLDREQLLHALDSRILMLDVVRSWSKDADTYSSGMTNTAYVMIKRKFAPAEERLRKAFQKSRTKTCRLGEPPVDHIVVTRLGRVCIADRFLSPARGPPAVRDEPLDVHREIGSGRIVSKIRFGQPGQRGVGVSIRCSNISGRQRRPGAAR